MDISAIDGTPVAGHEGPGSVTDIAVRRLLRLQGTAKPAQIVSAESYPGTDNTLTLPGYHGLIHVAFASPLAASLRPAPVRPECAWPARVARRSLPASGCSWSPSSERSPSRS